MQNWRHSDLARAFGSHLMQASHFTDEEPEAQRERRPPHWAGGRVCLAGQGPTLYNV